MSPTPKRVGERMVDSILSMFPTCFRPLHIQPLGNGGGFSGASLWRVQTDAGEICVRRWPAPHPSVEHLRWIHGVLLLAHRQGCDFIPAPIPSSAGETILQQSDRLWEVTPWMPGDATLKRHFSQDKLANACRALAQFHQAVAAHTAQPPSISPGISHRLRLANQFQTQLEESRRAVNLLSNDRLRSLCADVAHRAGTALRGLPERIATVATHMLAMQPCIRDIWYPHVLFTEENVSGIIDFGAMRIDTVALDLARLLSSVEMCDASIWQHGIHTYATVRPLSPAEIDIVHVAGQATAVLSGLQWVHWLAMEKRGFEDPGLVESRLVEILDQLGPRFGQ